MPSLRFAAFAAALGLVLTAPSAQAAEQVTLADAFTRAQGADASLLAAGARVDGADANIRQSGTRPNPSLGLDIENFGGTGPVRGLDDTETTLSYQQRIELGGKRDARIGLAQREREAVAARAVIAQLNLFESVQLAYGDALAAQAAIAVAQERLKVAKSLETEVGRRVASARDPEFAGTRVTVQVADAQLAFDQAKLESKAALARLASFWGGTDAIALEGAQFYVTRLPSGDGFAADIAVLEAERTAAAARVDVERSKSVTDPTLSLGVRHFSRNDDVAIIIGGSIPLTIFDDNGGNIDRAAAEERASSHDLAAYRIQRDREIARLRSQLAIAASEARTLTTEIIPAAERAVNSVREGFSRGAFAYLDVTDAQNVLSGARARHIAVLHRFHADKAALERLLGTHRTIRTTEAAR